MEESKQSRERIFTEQKDRRVRKRNLFYLAIIVISILFFFYLIFLLFFRIDSISVTGNVKYSTAEITDAIPVKNGDSLFTFSDDSIVEALKNAFPYIRSVEVNREIPSSVNIKIVEYTEVFTIPVEDDTYVLSDDFSILARNYDPLGVKTVSLKTGYIKSCMVGETISFCEQKLVRSLDELWQNICYYGFQDKIDYIEAENRFDIYFGYDGNLRVYIGDIQQCDAKLRFFVGIIEHWYEGQKGKLNISDTKEATYSPE